MDRRVSLVTGAYVPSVRLSGNLIFLLGGMDNETTVTIMGILIPCHEEEPIREVVISNTIQTEEQIGRLLGIIQREGDEHEPKEDGDTEIETASESSMDCEIREVSIRCAGKPVPKKAHFV